MSERFANENSQAASITAAGTGSLTGLFAGATIANILPSHVVLAPGIEVDPSLSLSQPGGTVAYGPTALHMPHLPVDIPWGNVGVKIDITKLDLSLRSSDSLNSLGALASQYHNSIAVPIQHNLVERLALGGGVGAAIGGFLGYKALQKVREQSLSERFRHSPRKAIATLLAGLAFASGVVYQEKGVREDSGPQTTPTPLSSIITAQATVLKDSTITGTGGELVNTLAYGAVKYIETTDKFWQKAAQNFETAWQVYQTGSGSKYSKDPNIVPILQLSDLHCNYSNYKNFLGTALEKIQATIILNDGDTFTNSNTMPYEKKCFTEFTNDVQSADTLSGKITTVINVAGNHDPKKSITLDRPRVITLDKSINYRATVPLGEANNNTEASSITFVGDADPSVTIWYPTLPADPVELNKAIAKQGANVAKAACEVTSQANPPVVLTHNTAAGYETILRGCASLVDNGHTHHDGPVQKYTGTNGNTVLQHTVGSASGADIGLTIYETPKQDATLTMQYYNKLTRQFVGFTDLVLHTDGTVSITPQSVRPAPNFDYTNMNIYLRDYSTAP